LHKAMEPKSEERTYPYFPHLHRIFLHLDQLYLRDAGSQSGSREEDLKEA
jgi:hypothetical protein